MWRWRPVASRKSPFRIVGQELRVELRVQPGASRNAVAGLADDGAVLLVKVTAPAEGGKANAAVIKLLAKSWKLPKSALSLARGHSSRRKSLRVDGDRERLEAWLAEI